MHANAVQVTDKAMVLGKATSVLGQRELAEAWLNHPAIALDGQRPLDMLSSAPGIEAVKDLLTETQIAAALRQQVLTEVKQ